MNHSRCPSMDHTVGLRTWHTPYYRCRNETESCTGSGHSIWHLYLPLVVVPYHCSTGSLLGCMAWLLHTESQQCYCSRSNDWSRSSLWRNIWHAVLLAWLSGYCHSTFECSGHSGRNYKGEQPDHRCRRSGYWHTLACHSNLSGSLQTAD